ncbi:hypothetical protein PQX77_006311 [Marasmius sp. AFHP31]|nr:hypothetical protein PQX77_006311 [Marasmius sp. AFHP31]
MPAGTFFKASLLLWAPSILQSSLVGAQIHATCTNSSFAWSFNSMRQSPCEIGESLGRVCRSAFTIQPLPEGYFYSGINAPSVTPCVCNTVYYTLLSVCGLCQGGSADRFDLWSENCTSTSTTFPPTIPAGVNVPNYAFLPLDRTNQTVDLNRLRADNGPESIGRGATGTRTSATFGPTGTQRFGGGNGGGSSSFDDEIEKEAKKAGIIAGVVVAVVYIIWAIGAGVIYWICRRQSKRRWGDPSQMYQNTGPGPSSMGPGGANTMGAYAAVPPGSPTSPDGKIYNPNDPSTYPQTPQTLGYQQPYTPDRTSMMASQPTTPNAYSTTAFPQQQQQQQAFSVTPDRNSVVTPPGAAAPMMNPYQHQHQAAMPMVSYDHTGSTYAPNRFPTPPMQQQQQPEPHRQAYMSGVPQV